MLIEIQVTDNIQNYNKTVHELIIKSTALCLVFEMNLFITSNLNNIIIKILKLKSISERIEFKTEHNLAINVCQKQCF